MNTIPPTKKLGELLLQRGLVTRAQLDGALQRQQTTREFLGAILVDMKAVTPDALLLVLSEQFKIPHESLTEARVDWNVAKQFPASLWSSGTCFPIRADAEAVTVAIANPLDAWSLSAVEKAAGFRRVTAILVLERELKQVFQAYQRRSLQAITGQLEQGHGPLNKDQ